MFKQVYKKLDEVITTIPEKAVVLDIGGASAPIMRADYVIDAVPYSAVQWNQSKGGSQARFSEKTYIQHDICSRTAWPFKDKQFDYSFCSHVLEDIRDPIWVCSEIIRVSKAGYIEIPSRFYETTFGLEIKGLAGASHHRWVIDLLENKLRFTFKYMQIHTKVVNKNRNVFTPGQEENYLKIEWSDSFTFYEHWPQFGQDVFEYFLGKKINEKEKWAIYRKYADRNIFINWVSYIKNTRKWPFLEKIARKYNRT